MVFRPLWLIGLMAGYHLSAAAFPCFLTVVKDKCWGDYEVTVNVADALTTTPVAHFILGKGTLWLREQINCSPGQKLSYAASFLPNIWESDKGVVFPGKRFLMLPSQIGAKQVAWELPLCYPDAFTGVPFPPNVSGPCGCDFTTVPPIELGS